MSRRQFILGYKILFVAIVCFSTIIHFVPSFLMAIAVLMGGIACDCMSGYICAYIYTKRFGVSVFLSREQNPVLKTLVEKSGPIRGLLLFQIHPKKLFSSAILMALGGVLYLLLSLLLSGTFVIFSAAAMGMFTFGTMLFYTTINNFWILLSDISDA